MRQPNITPVVSTQTKRIGASIAWAEKRKAERKPPMKGVYVFECEGFYKVGIASDVVSRRHTAQTGCPFEIRIISFDLCADARDREIRLHHALAAAGYHVRGEWFKAPLMELVSLLNVHLP